MLYPFPIKNPKLLVLEELAMLLENDSVSEDIQKRIQILLTDERCTVIANPNHPHSRALWMPVLRFIAYHQTQLPATTMARIRQLTLKMRKPLGGVL